MKRRRGLCDYSTFQRSGSAGVLLVLLLVAVVIVYAAGNWFKKPLEDPDTAEGLTPWQEWRIREKLAAEPKMPRSDQVSLENTLSIGTNLCQEDRPRGELIFTVAGDGTVFGAWQGDYTNSSKVHFDIMGGNLEGRVYPNKVFRDEAGQEDPSHLYFLCKGEFLVCETDIKSRLVHRKGDLYVRDWISPNHRLNGDFVITSDEKYSETFMWQTAAEVRKSLF